MEELNKKVVGLDVGNKTSQVCVMDERSGEVAERKSISTDKKSVLASFSLLGKSTVILEVGTHSLWLSRILSSQGHKVVVANARELRLIYHSKRKNDRLDAEKLARLGWVDQTLFSPVSHRSEQKQADLAVIRARASLLKVR